MHQPALVCRKRPRHAALHAQPAARAREHALAAHSAASILQWCLRAASAWKPLCRRERQQQERRRLARVPLSLKQRPLAWRDGQGLRKQEGASLSAPDSMSPLPGLLAVKPASVNVHLPIHVPLPLARRPAVHH